MFEDSLVESQVFHVSSSKRWTTLASVGLQVAIAGVVIVLPLLHPEALPFHRDAPKVLMPLMSKPPVPVVQTQREAATAAATLPAASVARPLILPSSRGTQVATNEAPSFVPLGSGMTDPVPIGIGVGVGRGPVVSVAPVRAPAARVNVSTGVLQGMLIAPIRPVYPAIAKAAGVQGSVVVEAIISRTGTIESLHVVSGPPMLREAALDAIRGARYQPYRLNGEPTEVQTRITVNFRMGG
jgi:periplasmic protein TonB